MAISTNRATSHCQYEKGFHYGKASGYDQIATGFGKKGTQNCSTSPVTILRSAQPTRFYSSPDLHYPGAASILQNRLSRDYQNLGRTLADQRRSWSEQAATLYYPTKSSAENAKKNVFQGLLGAIFDQARACRLIKSTASATCCIDSTGMENHYVSRHFFKRQGRRTGKYRRWTKLTAVCENQSHLIASAVVSTGPSTDCNYLKPAVAQAVKHVAIHTLLADSGYDAEYNHRLCREQFGIRSTVIRLNGRNLKYGRTGGLFRRRMKQRFPTRSYRRRWQIESVFSRFKRRLGNALTARTNESRTSECLLRVLTYNLMIVLFTFLKSLITNVFYRALLESKNLKRKT